MRKLGIITHRKCSFCKQELEIDSFCIDKSHNNFRSYTCRECSSKKRKMYTFKKITLDQFMKRVELIPGHSCWEWIGGETTAGYGKYDPLRASHCVIYELLIGSIPKGKIICHRCNNKLCVNPDHLYAGTYSDNLNDVFAINGRSRNAGENSSNSKLTDMDVFKIKDRLRLFVIKRGRLPFGSDSMRKIALDFNVTPSTIKRIKDGIGWTHINKEYSSPAYGLEEIT